MSRDNALVSADWAEKNLETPGIVFVEVDEDTTAYDGGHIPGAIKLDWKKDLQDPVRRDFVNQEQFSALLSERGVSNDDTVVLYGGNNNWFAAYAYWYFKLFGHEDVKLLDGGRKKWELEDRPLTKEAPVREPRTFTLGAPRDLRAFREEVIDRARSGAGMMIDVRSPDEFRGVIMAPPHLPQEQPYVPGHVPGAVNIPWAKAANEDGAFKTVEELRALYEGAGILPEGDVIAYCRIGERSSHTWFVLTELLGYPRVRNYDGSWTEYGSLVDVPVEL